VNQTGSCRQSRRLNLPRIANVVVSASSSREGTNDDEGRLLGKAVEETLLSISKGNLSSSCCWPCGVQIRPCLPEYRGISKRHTS
jgi:hypothetical protein